MKRCEEKCADADVAVMREAVDIRAIDPTMKKSRREKKMKTCCKPQKMSSVPLDPESQISRNTSPFLPLTPHDQSHNRNNQRRDTRQLQRLPRNTLLAAPNRRDRRIGKRRPTALVDLHRRSDIRRRHRLTQVTRRAGEDVHRVLQALGTGRPTRARQRDAQREEIHVAIARTRRVGDGVREAVVALRVLEASGLVEGRVGDQAVVRLHDEGIFVGIVIAAVGVAAELGGERVHEGGAGGEGDGTCCVESVGDEGDGLLRQEKGVGVLRDRKRQRGWGFHREERTQVARRNGWGRGLTSRGGEGDVAQRSEETYLEQKTQGQAFLERYVVEEGAKEVRAAGAGKVAAEIGVKGFREGGGGGSSCHQ